MPRDLRNDVQGITVFITERLEDWECKRRTGNLNFQVNFFQGGITTFKDGHEQTKKFDNGKQSKEIV